MARKIDRGLDIYDLLIDIVMNLSPLQAKNLYIELSSRYSKRGRTKLYNSNGELDSKGKVRLTEYQYKALRTDYLYLNPPKYCVLKTLTGQSTSYPYYENNQP